MVGFVREIAYHAPALLLAAGALWAGILAARGSSTAATFGFLALVVAVTALLSPVTTKYASAVAGGCCGLALNLTGRQWMWMIPAVSFAGLGALFILASVGPGAFPPASGPLAVAVVLFAVGYFGEERSASAPA